MPTVTKPAVSILIVSYNTRELTLAAIESASRETTANHEIIVVDNASSDGSAAAIASHPSRPRLIALDENIGFGRANNLAARHATADLVLLLNPDTVVRDGAIDRLLEFAAERPAAKIWGGRTIFADGSLNPSSCWHRMTVWNQFCRTSGLAAIFRTSELFNGEAFGGWQRDTVREVDIVSGCLLLIPRALWNELGGFDPLFFMYGEEADLCLRAIRAGARPAVTPTATIVHLGGASEATRSAKMIKLLAAKMSLANRHMHGLERALTHLLITAWPLTRLTALRLASMVSRNEATSKSAAAWSDIWRERDAWRSGYTADTATGHRLQARAGSPARTSLGTSS
ncbi:MAG: glycosyltransferase family 2 protein [Hyphomicrobiaceae bacterium]|nr:glycosyltransferase family 2 protein [Hyphomicrobiaceae bacterium]